MVVLGFVLVFLSDALLFCPCIFVPCNEFGIVSSERF